jgi:hypothetical protein
MEWGLFHSTEATDSYIKHEWFVSTIYQQILNFLLLSTADTFLYSILSKIISSGFTHTVFM